MQSAIHCQSTKRASVAQLFSAPLHGIIPSPSDEIIEAQVREIAEMKRLIAELETNPPADDAPDLAPSPQT